MRCVILPKPREDVFSLGFSDGIQKSRVTAKVAIRKSPCAVGTSMGVTYSCRAYSDTPTSRVLVSCGNTQYDAGA